LVGKKRARKLLESGGDTDLFQDLLKFLDAFVLDELVTHSSSSTATGTPDAAATSDDVTVTDSSSTCFDALSWLKELSAIEKFPFLVRFMDPALMSSLADWIARREGHEDTSVRFTFT
jgi:hypothetical protein